MVLVHEMFTDESTPEFGVSAKRPANSALGRTSLSLLGN